jgi:redox-sensitive bicupin YhaK (pirin superfamily)
MIEMIIQQRRRNLGGGVEIGRVLPFAKQRMVGPFIHLEMLPGATAEIPYGHPERALYVAAGAVELGGARHEAARMLVLGANASRVRALERSTVMVLGGEPVGKRYQY